MTVSLSNLKPSDFPEIKNVENLFGTNEDDTIYGNEEDNFLVGNAGNDSIFGENGNDTIIPSIGFDKLNGGKGNDTYLILTKDLINNKIEEIKNNSEIIQNELNKIKEPLNLLNLKYKIILKNTNDIYNKIQNYHSYMSEIKDIYINNIAATNELKELSKKIFAIGNNIYNISTQVKIKLKNYDTPSMNLEKNIDFIIDLNSNLNKLDESIKNNLIKVENFIK
ncbi:MAG: calcium-binding protein, partial [Silvanigrellaceae bacterium]|nr:calcium-binding protein [Silvanigrellaceae bacterium]